MSQEPPNGQDVSLRRLVICKEAAEKIKDNPFPPEVDNSGATVKQPISAPSTLIKQEYHNIPPSHKNKDNNCYELFLSGSFPPHEAKDLSETEEDIELPEDIFLPSRSHSKPKLAEKKEIIAQDQLSQATSKHKSLKTKGQGVAPLTLDLSDKLLFPEKVYPEYLIPPENFQLVTPFIYRSGFPKKKNFAFLKTLRIKTILTLILEDYPTQNVKFCEEHDIKIYQFGVAGNKEPFVDIPEFVIRGALSVLLDRRNHPILIHCNKGKHRTGCLVGCVRKMQGWSHTSIFDEYRRFAFPKARAMDQQFIELFNVRKAWTLVDPAHLPEHFVYPKWCPPYKPDPEGKEVRRVV